jgi:hypothetical protein
LLIANLLKPRRRLEPKSSFSVSHGLEAPETNRLQPTCVGCSRLLPWATQNAISRSHNDCIDCIDCICNDTTDMPGPITRSSGGLSITSLTGTC